MYLQRLKYLAVPESRKDRNFTAKSMSSENPTYMYMYHNHVNNKMLKHLPSTDITKKKLFWTIITYLRQSQLCWHLPSVVLATQHSPGPSLRLCLHHYPGQKTKCTPNYIHTCIVSNVELNNNFKHLAVIYFQKVSVPIVSTSSWVCEFKQFCIYNI